MSRVDATGAARAGSQQQTQLYVNRRPEELTQGLRRRFTELEGARIEWRSPLIAGPAAVVLPDSVLFEGGAGEMIRRRLLE